MRLVKQEQIQTTEADGSKTYHYAFEVDEETHPSSFGEAQRWKVNRDQQQPMPNGAPPSGFYEQTRSGHMAMMVNSGTTTDPQSGRSWRNYAILRPNGTTERISEEEFTQKYQPVGDARARAWWDEAFKRIPKIRTREVHLIGGAILGVWRSIQGTGARGLDVVRVSVGEQRYVGLQIPTNHVGAVLQALGVGRELVDPAAIFRAVVDQGEEIEIAGGMRLRRTMVHREPAFEIAGAPSTVFSQLDAIPGLLNKERIDGKRRFFIPTDAAAGLPVLENVLQRFPVIRQTTGATALRQGGNPDPNASAAEILRGADAEYRGGQNYVALNWQGRDVLSALSIKLGDLPKRWDAVTWPARHVRRLLELVEANEGLAALAPALRRAAQSREPVVFVEEGPHIGNGDELLREEQFHRAQMLAADGNWPIQLSRPAAGRMLLTPGGSRIARSLRAAGYTAEDLNFEVPAHAARGPKFWREAGITPQQAHGVLELYFALVAREHGNAVAEALRSAAPEEFDENGNLQLGREDAAGTQSGAGDRPDDSAPEEEAGPGKKGPALALAAPRNRTARRNPRRTP